MSLNCLNYKSLRPSSECCCFENGSRTAKETKNINIIYIYTHNIIIYFYTYKVSLLIAFPISLQDLVPCPNFGALRPGTCGTKARPLNSWDFLSSS